jgi:CelD/BcsL family acetyltransferase involved in cellulose biosynthesis
MHQILSTATAHRVVHTLPSPFTAWDNVASWDAYARSLSSNLRTGLARRRRRLAELGRISFELIDDPAEQAATIDWTLRRKIDWMSQKEKANNFLATQEYRNFLLTISEQSPVAGRLGIFALKCNERILAAKIVAVDESRCEGFITVYDPAFAAYSPGQIILADCLKWCQEQGLTYDFRIGEESYKRDWANGDCLATTYHLANTWLGVLQLAAATALRNGRQAKDRLRTCIPADSRRRTKARLLALRERLSRGYAPQVEISLNA